MGLRSPPTAPSGAAARVSWEHVVGAFRYDVLGDRREGRPLAVASNRVRDLIERGSSSMPSADAALARGLIIGDDRDEPPAMIDRFRRSGLSHLTAVSGQNVAFVLAAAGPLLRRARTGVRLAATLALIGWFVVLTRAEPSVLRAGAMAGLSAVGFALGRQREPPRLLAVAVIGLLLVDPLLRPLGRLLAVGRRDGGGDGPRPAARPTARALGPLAVPLGVTLGAQLGVALPSLLVFGRLPLVGTLANLLAVPVAGFVMLYGLPAALLAGAVPPLARHRHGCRWGGRAVGRHRRRRRRGRRAAGAVGAVGVVVVAIALVVVVVRPAVRAADGLPV